MTEKRQSGQMTAIATIFPNSKVSPDERNELIKDLPVSEFDLGYYALRSQQTVTGESPFIKTRQELQEALETFQIKIEERLLTEEGEVLCHHTARLTNVRQ